MVMFTLLCECHKYLLTWPLKIKTKQVQWCNLIIAETLNFCTKVKCIAGKKMLICTKCFAFSRENQFNRDNKNCAYSITMNWNHSLWHTLQLHFCHCYCYYFSCIYSQLKLLLLLFLYYFLLLLCPHYNMEIYYSGHSVKSFSMKHIFKQILDDVVNKLFNLILFIHVQ